MDFLASHCWVNQVANIRADVQPLFTNRHFFFCCVSINGCLRLHLSTLPYYVWYAL